MLVNEVALVAVIFQPYWQQLKRENAVGSHYSSPGGKCSRYFETKIPAEAVMLRSEKKC